MAGRTRPTDSKGASPEAVRNSIDRILNSRAFQGSPSLSRFLRHIVEQTLEGHPERLKEYTLGIDVLGRPERFDPRTDAAVRIHASRLRAKLAAYYRSEGAGDPVRIELGRGSYVPAFYAAPAPGRAGKTAAIATGGILLIALSFWWLRTPSAVGKAAPLTDIAVLPFDGATDTDHMSAEITSEVMSALARVSGLRLVGRGSASKFKGRNTDARQVGRELNVGAVVEGSVRTNGNRVRVRAQLVSTREGFQLWSQTFERSSEDASAIHDEIARGIARILNLPPPGEGSFWNRRTKDAEAYQLVLKARYLEPTTADTAETRIAYYRAAIGRDPQYAAPWIGMADTWCRLAAAGAQPPRNVMERARDAAARALQLDDASPDAHFMAANIRWSYEWDWTAGDREYRRAIQLDPNSATTRKFYAQYLAHMSRFDEAFSQLELVRKLEPVTSGYSSFDAAALYLSRQYDAAIRFCESALSANPAAWALYYWLGRAYGSTGKLKESVAALEKVHPGGEIGGRGFGMLGATYARAGRKADARKLLAQAGQRSKRAYVSPVSVAQIYLGLGDYDRAFEWLEKGYQDRDHTMTALKVEPAYDPVRNDPRFRALLRRMNLE